MENIKDIIKRVIEEIETKSSLQDIETCELINELARRKESTTVTICKDEQFELYVNGTSIEGVGVATIIIVKE
jgi:hypothetical protein